MISFFKLYEKIIGCGKAESKGEDDGVPPAMAQIIGRMMEQDAKWKKLISEIYKSNIWQAYPRFLQTIFNHW